MQRKYGVRGLHHFLISSWPLSKEERFHSKSLNLKYLSQILAFLILIVSFLLQNKIQRCWSIIFFQVNTKY
uniref:Uncharacterized protein n=1 Tax=Lepeophtheirus salmonis TaxID=72036 RepID=A0A0K2UUW9_LEPSM